MPEAQMSSPATARRLLLDHTAPSVDMYEESELRSRGLNWQVAHPVGYVKIPNADEENP